MAIITGTKKNDYIDTILVTAGVVGGPATLGADQIAGRVGDDEIHAGDGNDIVAGDGGHDRLFGDAGNDQIDGGDGSDFLDGGDGDDGLVGAHGNDRLDGGDGADRINGGRGDDVETGGSGADVFVISTGDDVVTDFSPSSVRDVLIDFEGIAGQAGSNLVPVDYLGLQWPAAGPLIDQFIAADDDSASFLQHPGAANVLSSGEAVGLLVAALPFFQAIAQFSSSQDFDLVSGNFAAGLMPADGSLDLTIEGFDDGQLVASTTLTDLSQDKNLIIFDATFQSIDTVRFTSSVSQFPSSTFNETVAMDDLLLRFFDGDGDTLQVGSASDITALLASAVDDGAGNTILGQGGNTTTLLGVAAADVTADWFTVG